MKGPRIDEWEWDDANLEELAAHGVGPEIVYQVGEETPLFRRNKKRRAATRQMMGPDRGGTDLGHLHPAGTRKVRAVARNHGMEGYRS